MKLIDIHVMKNVMIFISMVWVELEPAIDALQLSVEPSERTGKSLNFF